MLSIYCSAFNLENGLFDWQDTLLSFNLFADEVVVATTTACKDRTIEMLKTFAHGHSIKLVITDIPFSDLAFDGKLKNAALQACTEEFCCLFDLDERPINKKNWIDLAVKLKFSSHNALLVPVIDLYHDENHFRSLGTKWYIHKNTKDLQRGVANFAKLDNGKILHTRSDTCELILPDGNLASTYYIIDPKLSNESQLKIIKDFNIPYVFHYGWLDKKKRIKQQEFWRPVWNNRAGFEIDAINTMEELDNIPYWPHNL